MDFNPLITCARQTMRKSAASNIPERDLRHSSYDDLFRSIPDGRQTDRTLQLLLPRLGLTDFFRCSSPQRVVRRRYGFELLETKDILWKKFSCITLFTTLWEYCSCTAEGCGKMQVQYPAFRTRGNERGREEYCSCCAEKRRILHWHTPQR